VTEKEKKKMKTNRKSHTKTKKKIKTNTKTQKKKKKKKKSKEKEKKNRKRLTPPSSSGVAGGATGVPLAKIIKGIQPASQAISLSICILSHHAKVAHCSGNNLPSEQPRH